MCLQIYCCRLRANECLGPPGLSASVRLHGILHPMRSYTKSQQKKIEEEQYRLFPTGETKKFKTMKQWSTWLQQLSVVRRKVFRAPTCNYDGPIGLLHSF